MDISIYKVNKMDLNANKKTAIHSLLMINFFLLAVHTCLLIFFACTQIRLMAYVNVVSVLFYAISIPLLKYEKVTIYMFATFTEIMVHMFLAVISTGWDFGFQLYFMGCLAAVFYVDYFSVKLGYHHIRGAALSAISGLLYLASMLITRFWGSIYHTSANLAFAGMIANSVVVFAFVTVFFGMLTKIALYYEDALTKQATHDKLTGMVNRHFLVGQLDQIYASEDMSGYWLAILDIDNFKGINDKYGHLCGDFVLKSISEIIKKVCGDRTVCRWGGEEFVIVGSDKGVDAKGRRIDSFILEEIRRNVAIKDFVYDNKTTVNLTVTIGMARYQEGQTVDEWIRLADKRLYHGKHSGKNQVVETGE